MKCVSHDNESPPVARNEDNQHHVVPDDDTYNFDFGVDYDDGDYDGANDNDDGDDDYVAHCRACSLLVTDQKQIPSSVAIAIVGD